MKIRWTLAATLLDFVFLFILMFTLQIMISVKDLREYCRTCWVKLEIAAEDDATKVISTNKHPELEKLIQVCLAKTTADDDNISCYSPFLCRCCFDKWLDFLKLYQLATKTDEKIRAVLEKEALKLEFNNDEMNLQNSEENKAMVSIKYIFSYIHSSPLK